MTGQNAIGRLVAAGLTRGEIAAAVDATRAAVSHWERGRSIPGKDKLAALVRLGATRGVVLLASDFGRSADVPLPPVEEDPDADRIAPPVETA